MSSSQLSSRDRALLVSFAEFELDESNARLVGRGGRLELPPKAFDVLCALARQAGHLVTKDDLLDTVWGHRHVSDSVLKTTISQLRNALGDDAKQPQIIETVSRRGYRFIARIRQDERDGHSAVAAQASATQFVQLPDSAPASPALVGREQPLSVLMRCWQEAQLGRRQIVWVTGEAGIGKTSLIDALEARIGNTICARGQCAEPYGAGEPYLPILEALASLCRGDPELPALLRRTAPTWLMQMPWLIAEDEREPLQRAVSGAGQDRMLREMGEFLDRYTKDRRLLLVTEDLHWSDHATIRLIDHVARRRTPSRLMWIGSFRVAELISEDHPLRGVRHELRAHRYAEEIPLEALSETEVGEFIGRRMPGIDFGDRFVRSLHAHTEGLPLFLVSVIEDLQQSGALDDRGSTSKEALSFDEQRAIPESLVGVIEKQLARLPEETQALLEAASVCGMGFRPPTLADSMQRDPAWVAEQCAGLARRRIWISELGVERRIDGALVASYGFRHALYRRVLYQRASKARIAELHFRIAQSLVGERSAGGNVSPAELAMHFERGKDVRGAVKFYVEAAASAMTHFAPREAAHNAAQGLNLLSECPPDHERNEAELALLTTRGVAETQLHGVASPEAIATLARARELCELLPASAERARVLNGLGWILYTRGDFTAAQALAQRVIDHAVQTGDRELELSGCNLMGVTVCNVGHQADARSWLERGLALSLDMGRDIPGGRFVIDPEASIRANLVQPLGTTGLTEQASEQAVAALARAEAIGQPMAHVLAYWCACMLEIRLGNVERVAALSECLAEWVSRHSVAQGEGPSRWYRGWVMVAGGDAAAGYRMILEGYECHARLGMYAGCPRVLGYAAEALIWQSDWDGAARQIADALALAERIGEVLEVPVLWMIRARIEQRRSDAAAEYAALKSALESAQAIGADRYAIEALCAMCSRSTVLTSDRLALRQAFDALPDRFDRSLRARASEVLADH